MKAFSTLNILLAVREWFFKSILERSPHASVGLKAGGQMNAFGGEYGMMRLIVNDEMKAFMIAVLIYLVLISKLEKK